MPSENRLTRKQLQTDDTYHDRQNAGDDNSPLGLLLTALAIGAGTKLAYDKGLLKPIVKSGTEVIEKIASGTTDRAYQFSGAVKYWTKLEEGVPAKSIFRGENLSAFREAVESIRDTRSLSNPTIRNMIDDSVKDLNKLRDLIESRQIHIEDFRHDYSNTDLAEAIAQLKLKSNEINANFDNINIINQAKGIAVNEILTNPKYHLSVEAEKAALKKTGMRNVMIQDIFEKPFIDDATGDLVFKEKAGAVLSLYDKAEGKSTFERMKSVIIGGFNSEYRYMRNGQMTSLAGDWENFGRTIIDKHIYIDETGRLVDTRMGNHMIEAFKADLAKEFVIPGLNFNPIATLTDWGRTKQEALFGILDAKSFQPYITKMAGQYELGNVFNGKNGFFAGDTIYRVNAEGTGLEVFGTGFKFHDISRADTYGFNRTMKGTAKMADLNTPAINSKNRTGNAFVEAYDNIMDLGHDKLKLSREIKGTDEFNPDGTRNEKAKGVMYWMTHPGEFVDNFIFTPFHRWASPYEEAQDKIPHEVFNATNLNGWVNGAGDEIKAGQYVAVKSSMKISDIIEQEGITGKWDYTKKYLQDFLPEALGGRTLTGEMSSGFSERSANVYNLFDSVLDRLGNVAPMLRFENADKGNVGQYLFNIAAYRVAPIYMLTKVPGMINAMSEPIFGILGYNRENKKEDKYNDNRMNLGKFIMNEVVKPIDIGFHNVMDHTFITDAAKKVGEFLPGADQINELPGIYQLGLGQTKEERMEYIEKGFDPVRKARYWTMGNTPYTGGKIMYWRPNLYRRIEADVEFSDSKWGSRQEYYSNTWLPNPVNPLAPLNKLFDFNHYDKKHYHDRPYLMTAPIGENIPIVGHTIAAITSPLQQKQHKEYWQDGKPVELNDEQSPLITEAQRKTAWLGTTDLTMGPSPTKAQPFIQSSVFDLTAKKKIPGYSEAKKQNSITLAQINKNLTASQLASETLAIEDIQRARESIYKGNIDRRNLMHERIPIVPVGTGTGTRVSANILPAVTDNTFSTYMGNFEFTYQNLPGEYEIYSTPSGAMSVVDIKNLDLMTSNLGVQNYSIKKLYGTNERAVVNDPNRFSPQLADYSNEKIKNGFMFQMGEQYNSITDFFGMKGFELRTFATGEANKDAKTVETSGYAYSFNRKFWDQNLGGFGGIGGTGEEASEIFRRFVQKRNNNIDYINPIRNTMPDWMPGRDYFTDFKHGDPYTKVPNGEERLPGEGYERLYGINQEKMFSLGIGSSYIGKSEEEMIKHLLNDPEVDVENLKLPSKYGGSGESAAEVGNKMHEAVEKAWLDSGLAIEIEGQFHDKMHNITGFYDAKVRDITSPTGIGIVDVKSVNTEKFNAIVQSGQALYEHQSQVNYYLWATGNRHANGYVYYINRDDPSQTTTMGFRYNPELLRENLNTLASARNKIYEGLQNGTIGRGQLYSSLDKLRILADVAPYSQEYEDAKAEIAFALQEDSVAGMANGIDTKASLKKEVQAINERVKAQKEPLRLYPYKFSHADNVKTETVTVKEIIDNNHILVKQYGKEHTISLAGIKVSQSNSEMYDEKRTMNEAARKELKKYIRRGSRIQITYDERDKFKFNKDSTESIKASITSHGINVNKRLLNKGLATEKDQDTPAAMRARYSQNEIAVGSALEKITHSFAQIPFIGNKWLQVKSPYEQYRDREVYGKDFQSWENPIRDFLIPEFDKQSSMGTLGGAIRGAFIGSLFGGSTYGKIMGTTIGGAIGLIGGTNAELHKTKDRDWRPERRKKQEEINEYYDVLKYVKNMGLYEKYKQKSLREDHYDIEDIVNAKAIEGVENKNRSKELQDFKKTVKLDFKHRKQFSFQYGLPKYVDLDNMSKKETISAINAELAEIQSDRSVDVVPENAVRAIYYKQQAEQTMYGYEPGDPLQNLLKALPKKDRQYFSAFQNASKKEQQQILRIAPQYLRRALQQQYGMKVDEKPSLYEYFQTHGLPGADWIGWDEDVDLEDVKVKMVHQEKMDPGEFDIWDDQMDKANKTNIPIPQIRSRNSSGMIQFKLRSILSNQGYENVVVTPQFSNTNQNSFDVYESKEQDIEEAIANMDIS